MIKTLIVGGTGFVGKSILDIWHENDKIRDELGDVTVLARREPTDRKLFDSFETLTWDASNESPLPLDPKFDQIIHAASNTVRADIDYNQDFWNAIASTKSVIKFAKQHKQRPKLLYLSSGAVYGTLDHELGPVSETSRIACKTTDANDSYGNAKRVSEYLVTLANSEGFCIGLIARLFAFSGIHLPLDGHYAIGNFIHDALNEDAIYISGDGSAIRSYLDATDMAFWISRILVDGKSEQVYHVGSNKEISILELAKKIRMRTELLTGRSLEIKLATLKVGSSPESYYVPNTTVTQDLLGVKQLVSLDDSIDRMLTKAQSINPD